MLTCFTITIDTDFFLAWISVAPKRRHTDGRFDTTVPRKSSHIRPTTHEKDLLHRHLLICNPISASDCKNGLAFQHPEMNPLYSDHGTRFLVLNTYLAPFALFRPDMTSEEHRKTSSRMLPWRIFSPLFTAGQKPRLTLCDLLTVAVKCKREASKSKLALLYPLPPRLVA